MDAGHGKQWRSDADYWRERRAQSVAAILAETGSPDHAISVAQSLSEEYDRGTTLKEVASKLARRGLAGPAIEAQQASLRAAPYLTAFPAEKFGEVIQILARHGHGEGALQAAYAMANVDGASEYVEFDIASMICEAARTLAEYGWVDEALSTVRASRPRWNKPAAFTKVACAVALTGDVRRAVEIAETTVGLALAQVAAALGGIRQGRRRRAASGRCGPPGSHSPSDIPGHCGRPSRSGDPRGAGQGRR